ncbi:MAG TPA: hypothetical protein VK501_11770 [Baekduia sp.]|uniref:hypothetical protein n=1 Tax=Baekduia sp. TaxID=2600305 RepID=UPI002BC99A7E|nr:hypothetical protein [Baekduia sp.]HMJ34586.1 hypothetical protein [Baekduia sp.]
MAGTDAATVPVEDILARERTSKPRVGLAALAAAVLAVLAGVLPQAIYSDFPRVFVLDAVRDAAGESIGREGLRTAQILFIDDHALSLLLVAVAQAATAVLIGVLLVFLFDASVARGAATPRIARLLALLGSGATALSAVVLQVAVMISASDFASSSDHSTAAAHDALRGGVVVAASGLGFFGSISVAAAFVLITIGAMRVGLLTRFLGVLGAIVGALILLGPLSGSPTFIVQAFWLAMMGALLLGKFPRNIPPAWTSGEAMPWPTQQELREERGRGRADSGGGGFGGFGGFGRGRLGPSPSPSPAPPAPSAPAGPSSEAPSPATSARKKRKRRG